MLAAIMTGFAVAYATGHVGRGYVAMVGLGALAAVFLVEVRSLFITAAIYPIFYTSFTPAVTVLQIMTTPEYTGRLSKTQLISSVYPMATLFPYFLLTVIVVIVVAFWRYHKARKRFIAARHATQATRIQAAAQDREHVAETVKARNQIAVRTRRARGEQPNQVSVDELVRKSGTRARRQVVTPGALPSRTDAAFSSPAAVNPDEAAPVRRAEFNQAPQVVRPNASLRQHVEPRIARFDPQSAEANSPAAPERISRRDQDLLD